MAEEPPERILVDPSFLLSAEGFAWFRDYPETLEGIVISEALRDWIVEGKHDFDPSALLAPEDVGFFEERRDDIVNFVGGITTFSHEEADLSGPAEEVRGALLEDPELHGALIYADEWAFLQSHSRMLSKLRHPLKAFRDAGAVIVEIGRKAGRKLLEKVIPAEHLPEHITGRILLRAGAKWIVVAGAGLGGGALGGVIGGALGPAGAPIGHEIGRRAGTEAASAVCLAIDP
jgi:hypothetical protein